MKDCRCKSASLLLRSRLQLGGQGGGRQMLVLCSICLSDDGDELSTGSAWSAHVCCSADRRQDSYIKGFCFPQAMQVHLISSISVWGCNIKWWRVDQGCRLLTALLVINGHSKGSQVLRIDSAFALGEAADNGVWYSNMSLPDFWLTVTQTRSPSSHSFNLVTFTVGLTSPV